jgi:hypothetical protein
MKIRVAARRSLSIAALCGAILAAPACSERVHKQPTIEEAPKLASTIQMGDTATAAQLVKGFHNLEDGRWRWTQKQFALALRPPVQASQKGAVLELHLTVPQSIIDALKSITLTATLGGVALAPETYRKAGEYTYKRDVEPKQISGDAVRIDFQLDKAVPPGTTDQRELGIVVTSAGLVAK